MKWGEKMDACKRKAQIWILFVLIMLGWLGDSLLSLVIRRPLLSFDEVYRSWREQVFWVTFPQ
jgi:hypothetical protein